MKRLYFAYGSNMDARQMAYRCRGAESAGLAVLRGYRFLINQRGYATVVPDAKAVVHGVLWELTPGHERALDTYEAVAEGMYVKRDLPVERPGQPACEALIYLANHFDPGPPRQGYLEKILFGAEAFGLPADYVDELRTWASFIRNQSGE